MAQKIARSKGQYYKYADLYLAENWYLSGNFNKADHYIGKVIAANTVKDINSILRKHKNRHAEIVAFQEKGFVSKIVDETSLILHE